MNAEHAVLAGRFVIGPLIGGGATGCVYAGTDLQSGEKVAIKVLREDLAAGTPELLERFQREWGALSRLNHPNIVKMIAAFVEKGRYYIVMEYVPGGSLADLLQRQPQLPVEQALTIGLELADALSRAHHLNILHCDVKPANILLSADSGARLTDFGLPHLALGGSIPGALQYLSPEALDKSPLDARSDLWSLGVVLYEMLAGGLPFSGDTVYDLAWAIKNNPLPDLTWKRQGLPPRLVELIQKMMMKDPPLRLPSVRLVGAELEMIQASLNAPSETTVSAVASVIPGLTPVKIRVLIVDDHAVVRQGLRPFIDLQDDLMVVAEGENGIEAISLAGQLKPDLVLLDLVMPQMDGVEATRRILQASPNSRVLVLTSFGEDEKVLAAIQAGAHGYLLKDIHPNDLIRSLREAHKGKVQLHPEIARKLMTVVAAGPTTGAAAGTPSAAAPPLKAHPLTERELEVLRLIAQGMSNQAIAEAMIISEKTVKTHVSNILGKLGLDDRTQAAIWAHKNHLADD